MSTKTGTMTLGWSHHVPSSILHLDGDGFFAACEIAMNPALRGKCVVTGAERGIASAMSYEAKARGVKRGMPLHEIRRVCPEAIIVPSNYETYSVFNRRMINIVRRYTDAVEEYSIDECFADLAGLQRPLHMSYEKIARAIKRDIQSELGITVSCGLAPNKVLAKVGSKWQKPDGFTLIHQGELERFLADLPAASVWGIGPQTAAFLRLHGMETAGAFAHCPSTWVHNHLTKPTIELWRELQGERVLSLALDAKKSYQSMQHTRTFRPATADPAVLLRELSSHCEAVCARARRFGLYAERMSFFLKTSQFRYRALEVKLPSPTNIPNELVHIIASELPALLPPLPEGREASSAQPRRSGRDPDSALRTSGLREAGLSEGEGGGLAASASTPRDVRVGVGWVGGDCRIQNPKTYLTPSLSWPGDGVGPTSQISQQFYRATGVTLSHLTDAAPVQQDLFGTNTQSERYQKVFAAADALAVRYRKPTVTLGSSKLSKSEDGLGIVPLPLTRGRLGGGSIHKAQDRRPLDSFSCRHSDEDGRSKKGAVRNTPLPLHIYQNLRSNLTTPRLLTSTPSPFRLPFAGEVG